MAPLKRHNNGHSRPSFDHEFPPEARPMRFAIAIGLQTLLFMGIGSAQQDPAQPATQPPAQAKPADTKTTAPANGVDPQKMAAPKGGKTKIVPSAVDNSQYI